MIEWGNHMFKLQVDWKQSETKTRHLNLIKGRFSNWLMYPIYLQFVHYMIHWFVHAPRCNFPTLFLSHTLSGKGSYILLSLTYPFVIIKWQNCLNFFLSYFLQQGLIWFSVMWNHILSLHNFSTYLFVKKQHCFQLTRVLLVPSCELSFVLLYYYLCVSDSLWTPKSKNNLFPTMPKLK